MRILFEVIKFLYYCITIALALLYFKGSERLSAGQAQQSIAVLLPGYLVFTGILLGYIAYEIFEDNEDHMSGYFIGGTILGIILVILSITLGRGKFEVVG